MLLKTKRFNGRTSATQRAAYVFNRGRFTSHSGADPLLSEPALKNPFLSAFETGSRSDHCGLLASVKAGE
jgi:hypothetical protein